MKRRRWSFSGLGGQNEGCKFKMCVWVVMLKWGGIRWRCSGMIESSIWRTEGIRDLEGGISFQIPGFGMSNGKNGGRSN